MPTQPEGNPTQCAAPKSTAWTMTAGPAPPDGGEVLENDPAEHRFFPDGVDQGETNHAEDRQLDGVLLQLRQIGRRSRGHHDGPQGQGGAGRNHGAHGEDQHCAVGALADSQPWCASA